MSKEIPLTRGLVAIVDDEDYPRLTSYRWLAAHNRNCDYAVRQVYFPDRRTQRFVPMHREILGAKASQKIDHVNGNGLDNRRCNLRLASNSQNQANGRLWSSNTSGFKGVSRDGRRSSRCWRAYLQVNGRRVFCGSYSNPRDAAMAYDETAVKYFGEFARTNASMGLLS